MIIKLSTRISTFLARLYKLEIFFFNPKKHSPLHRRSTQPREFRFKQTFYFLRMLSQTFRFSFHAQMVLNKMSFYMFLQQQKISLFLPYSCFPWKSWFEHNWMVITCGCSHTRDIFPGQMVLEKKHLKKAKTSICFK